MADIVEPIKNILQQLRETFNVSTAVGQPIVIEDKTLIPLIGVGVGAASGSGEGKVPEGKIDGVGVGGIVRPIAILVVFKGVPGPDGIKVIEIKPSGGIFETFAEFLPRLAGILPSLGTLGGSGKKIEDKEKSKLMQV